LAKVKLLFHGDGQFRFIVRQNKFTISQPFKESDNGFPDLFSSGCSEEVIHFNSIKYILKDGGTAILSGQELINRKRKLVGKAELGEKNVWHICFGLDLRVGVGISKFCVSVVNNNLLI
jgi:hypothetical protein